MFNIFHWKQTTHWERLYIENEFFGVEVLYTWTQKEGTFYLSPLFDQNNSTWKYYAFDVPDQKERFEKVLKIQGIGGKSGYHIAMLPYQELKKAIEEMDAKYFQKLPGVWPKTAKRLLIELKTTISQEDMQKLSTDDKVLKDVTGSLQSLWYSVQQIKKLIPDLPHAIEQENIPVIMKWLIDNL